MSKSSELSVVIPAAGFGTRMGKPVSKEMLLNPATGFKFVTYSLEQARALGAKVILVTRKEKQELIKYVEAYCKEHQLLLELLVIEPTGEWPETVLMSEHGWSSMNILLLPDTDWKPTDFLQSLVQTWIQRPTQVIYGVFDADKTNWGYVKVQDGLYLCEKPQQLLEGFYAWGMIGFRKEVGAQLFKEHLSSTFDHQMKYLKLSCQLVKMDAFFDRTRGE